jgi:hypothetical protein
MLDDENDLLFYYGVLLETRFVWHKVRTVIKKTRKG